MILVVGGLNGFIGSNTTEALVDLGKDCVVTRHENIEIPGFLKKHIDHRHVFIERADSTSNYGLTKDRREAQDRWHRQCRWRFLLRGGPAARPSGILRHARRHLPSGTGMESQEGDILKHRWNVSRDFGNSR